MPAQLRFRNPFGVSAVLDRGYDRLSEAELIQSIKAGRPAPGAEPWAEISGGVGGNLAFKTSLEGTDAPSRWDNDAKNARIRLEAEFAAADHLLNIAAKRERKRFFTDKEKAESLLRKKELQAERNRVNEEHLRKLAEIKNRRQEFDMIWERSGASTPTMARTTAQKELQLRILEHREYRAKVSAQGA